MKNTALFLIACWLIAGATLDLTHWHFNYQKQVLAAVAMGAGVILLLTVIRERFRELGLFLLAVWLILENCLQLFHWSFPYSASAGSVLAIVAGLLLILRK